MGSVKGLNIRVILIQKSFLDQIVHVPKLFSLLHWSQNIFCFLCSSTPSHVGKFFRLQWEFQWENDQNKKKFPLTCLVTGGLTLFHQTGVVRAIPAKWCLLVGGGGGADMETCERYES